MSRPVLILKTGSTLPAVRERHGDFDWWFIEPLQADGREPARFRVIDLPAGADPGAPDACAGVVITGSPLSMTVPEPWFDRAMEFLRSAADAGAPILGVCFGHQMLAAAFGGRVEQNPRGREIGTVEVSLTAAGAADGLFEGLGQRFSVNATHVDAVVELPPGAVVLATNDRCPVQAYSLGDRIRAVQWHPEIGREVIRGYIAGRSEILKREGFDPEDLLARASDTPSGGRILRNFDRRFVGTRP
ncbi:MAG: glutamine amidotransferase [Deltaproteobacteria bacterium]|nr:glutamine amidotransferase [Deltaproteobacteria bacterium]